MGKKAARDDVDTAIIDAIRRFTSRSERLTHVFASRHGLQPNDLQALVAILSAQGTGVPLTPGRLREHVGLSSAGTTYLIDRLEKAGYVQRTQDHPRNRRIVQLRYTDQGMATVMEFFGPIGARTKTLLGGFTPEETAVIHRFMTAIADQMEINVAELGDQ